MAGNSQRLEASAPRLPCSALHAGHPLHSSALLPSCRPLPEAWESEALILLLVMPRVVVVEGLAPLAPVLPEAGVDRRHLSGRPHDVINRHALTGNVSSPPARWRMILQSPHQTCPEGQCKARRRAGVVENKHWCTPASADRTFSMKGCSASHLRCAGFSMFTRGVRRKSRAM
jgi:hypothetical protein